MLYSEGNWQVLVRNYAIFKMTDIFWHFAKYLFLSQEAEICKTACKVCTGMAPSSKRLKVQHVTDDVDIANTYLITYISIV